MHNIRLLSASGALGLLMLASCLSSFASGQDISVYVFRDDGSATKRSGQLTEMTPEGLTVDGEMIPSEKVREINIAREPNQIDRARDQMNAGRFSDAIEELKKIDDEVSNPLLVQEIDFINAFSTAKVSQLLGSIGAADAGRVVQAFLTKHPNSFHRYPAQEQYGLLIFAFGKPDLAAPEFEKLQQAEWTEYRLKGFFQYGRMQDILGNREAAIAAYDKILAETGTDDQTQQFKLLAEVEKAKLVGLGGNPDQAVAALNKMILEQSSKNTQLFAYLYNALGAVHQAAGKLKDARTAYMHTQVLYASESMPHAESMFRLASIWQELEQNERANEARELLKTRYRNSYWAQQL